ncbi:MAG: GntR family transcriptional regulator [Microbacteriaceae bacterium]|nr:GntR family transcriptional regulator [Microbacteriaceae bacterium]MCL2795079.1 GntR family transcriptional regulator [Microbacteriaceae bacterium]
MTRYQELAADLRARIAHGEFAVGSVLPSENALAEAYGVSRGTIRNALGTLAARGMVEPARGTGWVISSGLQAREFDTLRTFPEWAESHGMRPGGLVVESRRDLPTPAEARVLRIAARDEVLRVTRVRTLDGQPVMIERAAFAPWVAPLIEALPADEPSIVRVFQREGIRSTRGSHRIDAVAASSEDARLLGVPRSSPILRVRREYGDQQGRIIEVGEDRYVGGAVAFAIEVDETGPHPG